MTNCNYKLLKDAHIGVGVRMSKDKNTIPFTNEPMTGMIIERYSKLGFQISHPNLGKTIWVDFKQLPLTSLTMIDGVIQDEITFVENIVAHQMELIKTDNPEYQELLVMKEEEKLETFTTLAHTLPGEVVVSALCKEGIALVYLGTWFIKDIHRCRAGSSYQGYTYINNPVDKFYLEKQSPKRAFFIVDSEDLTEEERKILNSINQEKIDRSGDEDWNAYYKRVDVTRTEYWKKRKEKEKEIRKNGPKERFKIISYPVTSKKVRKLIKTDVFNDKFTDLEYNKEMILNFTARKDGDHYGKREDQKELAELNKTYPVVDMKDFVITNPYYTLDDVKFMSTNKNDIDKKAYNFINTHFQCTLQEKLWVGKYDEPIDFEK